MIEKVHRNKNDLVKLSDCQICCFYCVDQFGFDDVPKNGQESLNAEKLPSNDLYCTPFHL